jgi:hypothetical protein
MNNLSDGKGLTEDSAEEILEYNPKTKASSSENFLLVSSAIGTDLKSVNIKHKMTTFSETTRDNVSGSNQVPNSNPENNNPSNDEGNTPIPGSSDEIPADAGEPEEDHGTGSAPEITGTNANSSSESESIPVEQGDRSGEEIEELPAGEKDYHSLSKEDIVDELGRILGQDNLKAVERRIYLLKDCFEVLLENDRKAALEIHLKDGGDDKNFSYKNDKTDNRFDALLNRYKSKKTSYYSDLEKQKEVNLQKKHQLLETLRKLVDSEETTASIGALKKIQQEWKSIGPIPGPVVRSLWASYNALLDRFYDKRSIYFELKELDRKKNLEAKIEICDKAEKLTREKSLREAIRELNELHEEFKHIGPVPSDQQEAVWHRFKAASDQIYSRRKEFIHELKKSYQENLDGKKKLIEDLESYKTFTSESIAEWNSKTREILEMQKKWEAIGGLPREQTRTINKSFWSAFKTFFSNKNKFFKTLEGKREENLRLKEDLVNKAIALKDSQDWEGTANALKELQLAWKDIGPVPEKDKAVIFDKFKQACDEFFENRRKHSKEVEVEYVNNLRRKEEICTEMEKMVSDNIFDIERFQVLQGEYEQTGFVPRNAIKKIQKRFNTIAEKFLEAADVSEEQKSEMKFSAEINKIKSRPDSDRKLQRKEMEIRKMINKIDNDITIWKNNLDFFRESDTADKLKAEFNIKIEKATAQLNELKEELKILIKS